MTRLAFVSNGPAGSSSALPGPTAQPAGRVFPGLRSTASLARSSARAKRRAARERGLSAGALRRVARSGLYVSRFGKVSASCDARVTQSLNVSAAGATRSTHSSKTSVVFGNPSDEIRTSTSDLPNLMEHCARRSSHAANLGALRGARAHRRVNRTVASVNLSVESASLPAVFRRSSARSSNASVQFADHTTRSVTSIARSVRSSDDSLDSLAHLADHASRADDQTYQPARRASGLPNLVSVPAGCLYRKFRDM